MSLATRLPPATEPGGRRLGRRGLALPSAMFAVVTLSVLIAGLYTFADLSAKATRNRESATRSVHVAEAGINHTLGLMRESLRMHSFTRLLRGSDNVVATADDSVLTGWGLSSSDEIPLAGQTFQGHSYFVSVRDDAADGDADAATDLNGRLLVRCRAVTSDGASLEVAAVIGAVPFPAVAADGNLHFSGTPQIAGVCGGVHSNGNVSAGSNTTIQTQATATGTATGGFKLPDGTPAPKLGGQPEVPIPDLVPLDHCVGADFRLTSTGNVVNLTTGASTPAIASPVNGWKRSSGPPLVKWDLAGIGAVGGTYCVEGNAYISGNNGTAVTPLNLSVVATGSIEVSGNPFLIADHDDEILFLAGGDLSISGNPAAGANNFQGLIYAGAQCKTSGNPVLFGQLMCANGAQPAGSVNIIANHEMSGNFTLTFDCSANVFNRRRVLFWYPQIGT